MRVRTLLHAVLSSSRKARLTAAGAMVGVGAIVTPLVLVSAPDASASAQPTPARVVTVSLAAPSTVTKDGGLQLRARATIGGLPLAGRPLQFVEHAPGAPAWARLAEATTDSNGVAAVPVTGVESVTEYGAYYADLAGTIRSTTATALVHVIDMKPAAPSAVAFDAPVRLAGHLLQDAREGIAGQRVQVRFRTSARDAWSAPTWVTTDRSGIATLTRRFTHSFQVGIRFPGATSLAPSPLAVASVVVKARPAVSSTGFRFPFLNPGQAESPGAWSLDQGVDMFAQGQACGAAAKLVAVGDGTVIQTGIQGFGPTAPVIRMSSGPFKGRNVYYGHTGHIYVHAGQQVHMGDLVAQIGCGQVGYSAAPHLEIGVGEPGGPPCCPPMHATASEMYHQLVAALHS